MSHLNEKDLLLLNGVGLRLNKFQAYGEFGSNRRFEFGEENMR